MAWSAMVGLGETYLPAFALAGGLGEVAAGLSATLPLLAGALLQLVTPLGVRWLGSYRRWVVACAQLQALCFVPLILAALAGEVRLGWIFGVAAAYWGFGMATGPAWNAWVGALVPAERRPRFFASRTRWSQLALVSALLAGGAILDLVGRPAQPLAGFAAIFALAAVARLISARFLASQSEPAGLASGHRMLGPAAVWGYLRRSGEGHLLAYLLAMQVAVHVAAPFFTPYMLGPLGLSYAGFTVLTAASFVARVLALPVLGRVAQRRGARRVLWIGAAGIVPLPVLWLVSDARGYLLCVQLLAGTMWAAVELATLLAFFESLEIRYRASVLTAYNLANALAMALGSLLGGFLFRELGEPAGAYALIFAVSSLGRVAALPLLRRVVPPRTPPRPEVVARSLAVRPSIGAIQRPLLPGLEGERPVE